MMGKGTSESSTPKPGSIVKTNQKPVIPLAFLKVNTPTPSSSPDSAVPKINPDDGTAFSEKMAAGISSMFKNPNLHAPELVASLERKFPDINPRKRSFKDAGHAAEKRMRANDEADTKTGQAQSSGSGKKPVTQSTRSSVL